MVNQTLAQRVTFWDIDGLMLDCTIRGDVKYSDANSDSTSTLSLSFVIVNLITYT
jgi:hypothetical protein